MMYQGIVQEEQETRQIKDAIDLVSPVWRQINDETRFGWKPYPRIVIVEIEGVKHAVASADSILCAFGGGHLTMEENWEVPPQTSIIGAAIKTADRSRLDETRLTKIPGFIHFHRSMIHDRMSASPDSPSPSGQAHKFFKEHFGEFSCFFKVRFVRMEMDEGEGYYWRAIPPP